jgi:hypothetical protein
MRYYYFGKFTGEWVGTARDKTTWIVNTNQEYDSFLAQRLPLCGCREIIDWPRRMVLTTPHKTRREDMPETFAVRPIVSDRLCRLIHSIDPKAAQYLPIQILYRGKLIEGTYWLANWLHEIDCVDWVRSDPKGRPADGECEALDFTVIDGSRVPPRCHVFRPSQVICKAVCSETLKHAIEDAGITGCGFLPLDVRTE